MVPSQAYPNMSSYDFVKFSNVLLATYWFVNISYKFVARYQSPVASGEPQNRWRWWQLCKFCCSKLFKRDVTWCLTWDKAHHLTTLFHLLFARFASSTCLCQSVAIFAQRSSLIHRAHPSHPASFFTLTKTNSSESISFIYH